MPTAGPAWELRDLGDCRELSVNGRPYRTNYSDRVIRMLIERKGPERAVLYFPFKQERGPFLGPLLGYLRRERRSGLRVLEVGCSFGHMTEVLAEQPEIAEIHTFDTDPAFVRIVRTKVEELDLERVREVRHLSNEATGRLPWADGAFDVVVVIGVVEHLPLSTRRIQVDEYYRVLAPGGCIVILDTPNRWFPLETHSIGLPLIQWLPAPVAWRYARAWGPARMRNVSYEDFTADGTGWRNATFGDCLPTRGRHDLEDVTEDAGYGWQFFRDTARSRTRRALLPAFALATSALRLAGRPPSLALPYLNLLFRRKAPVA